MTNKAKLLGSVLALIVAAGAVSAHEGAHGAPKGERKAPEFSQLDRNADGKVTPEEVTDFHAAQKAEAIKSMDANADGFITLEEMKAAATARAPEGKAEHAAKKAEERFKKMDSEGAGQISVETLLAPKADGKGAGKHGKMFEKFDADKDGALSAEEYAKAAEKHGRKGHKGHKHRDQHGHEGKAVEAKPAE